MYTKPVLTVQTLLSTGRFNSTNVLKTSFDNTNVHKTSFYSTNVHKSSFYSTNIHFKYISKYISEQLTRTFAVLVH